MTATAVPYPNQRLPRLAWLPILGSGFAIWLAFIGVMELRLAARGFAPNLIHAETPWLAQRERAAALGQHALILVGGSRILLDTDIDSLRRETGLEPVQLAVDGCSFVPVLAGLAGDPRVTGTVLVDLEVSILAQAPRYDSAYEFQQDYARRQTRLLSDFEVSETYLTEVLHARLRSYADGTQPLTALRERILSKSPTPQYLSVLPDREVLADYRRTNVLQAYFVRVTRDLGETVPDMPAYALYQELNKRIAALAPADDRRFLESLGAIRAMSQAIQARGGRVLFALFPNSGQVRAIADRRYPRQLFWDRFAASMPSSSLDFEDVPELAAFTCPDGSHLDYRDRARFTHALVAALRL